MNARKRKAIECLIREPTKKQAAKSAGISESTLRSYFHDEDFLREYNARIDEIISDTVLQSKKALSPAFKVLLDIANSRGETTSNRIAAARSVCDFTLRFMELSDIMIRLEKLEKLAGGET